jgi:hypothetical protein
MLRHGRPLEYDPEVGSWVESRPNTSMFPFVYELFSLCVCGGGVDGAQGGFALL